MQPTKICISLVLFAAAFAAPIPDPAAPVNGGALLSGAVTFAGTLTNGAAEGVDGLVFGVGGGAANEVTGVAVAAPALQIGGFDDTTATFGTVNGAVDASLDAPVFQNGDFNEAVAGAQAVGTSGVTVSFNPNENRRRAELFAPAKRGGSL